MCLHACMCVCACVNVQLAEIFFTTLTISSPATAIAALNCLSGSGAFDNDGGEPGGCGRELLGSLCLSVCLSLSLSLSLCLDREFLGVPRSSVYLVCLSVCLSVCLLIYLSFAIFC